jgi:hypothetical protein
MVYVRTLVGGEPEILRPIAAAGLFLTGICAISLAFDFAPRKVGRLNTPGMQNREASEELVSEVTLSVEETNEPRSGATSQEISNE